MAKDLWLPKGYDLPNGAKLQSLLSSGVGWQIYDSNGSGRILLASPELVQKWSNCGLLDESLFSRITFGCRNFRSLSSDKQYILAGVESGRYPESKVDALAFAYALKESRKLSEDSSFHDAVYVEQYSRLLPSWSLTPHVEDEVVLGTWMTGGVVVSTLSFRRLTQLTGWMSAGDLLEVIDAAGLSLPPDGGLLARCQPASCPKECEESVVDGQEGRLDHLESLAERKQPKVFRLPGRAKLEAFLNEYVIDILYNAQRYQALGIDFPCAIILHGPPGCGKTFAVERLVEFLDWPSFSIDSSSVGSPFIHETSKKISEVFSHAIDSSPSVLVIDEMESFLSDRRSGSGYSLHHVEEVAEFLRRIPEAREHRVLIIAMTNMIEMIDSAILRRGRFDHIIEVDMPTKDEVQSLVESLLSKLPTSDALDVDTVFDALTGRALSDAAFVIREAARLAAKAGKTEIDQISIEKSLKSLPECNEKKSNRIGFIREHR